MSKLPQVPSARPEEILIGALLRVPSQAIHRRIIEELNAAGFEGLRIAHMAVLRYPGPDGERPSTLAERAGVTKQAMNQLLKSLESLGYIRRDNAPGAGNMRIVRLTERGHAAYAKIIDILRQIEREWGAELGRERFAQLKKLLVDVWTSKLVR